MVRQWGGYALDAKLRSNQLSICHSIFFTWNTCDRALKNDITSLILFFKPCRTCSTWKILNGKCSIDLSAILHRERTLLIGAPFPSGHLQPMNWVMFTAEIKVSHPSGQGGVASKTTAMNIPGTRERNMTWSFNIPITLVQLIWTQFWTVILDALVEWCFTLSQQQLKLTSSPNAWIYSEIVSYKLTFWFSRHITSQWEWCIVAWKPKCQFIGNDFGIDSRIRARCELQLLLAQCKTSLNQSI
jgi:hypothetical protein